MAKFYLIIISFCFFAGKNICAQERINADRPGETQPATLTPPHYFQAEFGFGKENFDKNNYDIIQPTTLFKYGLTKSFELRLGDDFITQRQQLVPQPQNITGFQPVEIGFRTAVCQQKNFIPQTSVITQIAIPELASDNFKAKHFAPTILLAMQNTITKSFGIGYNLGTGWDGFTSTPAWLYSVSCGFNLSKNLQAFIEAYGSAVNDNTPANSVDGGFSYYISNNVVADASAGFGISNAASDYFFQAGVSFRIK